MVSRYFKIPKTFNQMISQQIGFHSQQKNQVSLFSKQFNKQKTEPPARVNRCDGYQSPIFHHFNEFEQSLTAGVKMSRAYS